jgi:hypothetical protein
MLDSIPGIPIWLGILFILLGTVGLLARLGRAPCIIAVGIGIFAFFHSTPDSIAFLHSTRDSKSGPSESPLSVDGEASKNFFDSMGLGGTAPNIQYNVKVTIRNTQGGTLTFDQVQGKFYPESGHQLRSVWVQDPNNDPADSYARLAKGEQVPELKLWTVGPGAAVDHEFQTNGHTFDLLEEASGKPLRFSVEIRLNGVVIAGPYVAVLPPLEGLPYYDDVLGGGQKAFRLLFSGDQ